MRIFSHNLTLTETNFHKLYAACFQTLIAIPGIRELIQDCQVDTYFPEEDEQYYAYLIISMLNKLNLTLEMEQIVPMATIGTPQVGARTYWILLKSIAGQLMEGSYMTLHLEPEYLCRMIVKQGQVVVERGQVSYSEQQPELVEIEESRDWMGV